MKRLVLPLLVVSQLAFAQESPSVDECDDLPENPNVSKSTMYSRCLDKHVSRVEKEMTTWINSQQFDLQQKELATGRKSILTIFNRSQKQFKEYRESNCRWYYLAEAPKETASNDYKKCMIRMTQVRIDELQSLAESKPAA